MRGGARITHLVRNLGFDELSKESERLLPTEVASLRRNCIGHSFLHDTQIRPDRYLRQRDRDWHVARKAQIIECFDITNAFSGNELLILTVKGMAVARAKVRE